MISKGERTDIYVDAVVRNSRKEVYDSVSVIIEVKGCWNEKLYTEMENQLVNRYLKDNHCHAGLYLIGWFNCSAWETKGDSRYKKSKTRNTTIDELREQFDLPTLDSQESSRQAGLVVLPGGIGRRTPGFGWPD